MTKDFFVSQILGFEAPITRMAAMLPEDKLDWRPCPKTMPARVLLQHLADAVRNDAKALTSGDWKAVPPDFKAADGKNRDDLIAELKAAFASAAESFESLTDEDLRSRPITLQAGERRIEGTVEELGVSITYRHLASTTMQLFWYLKQAGIEADSGVLYFGLEPGEFSTRFQPEAQELPSQ